MLKLYDANIYLQKSKLIPIMIKLNSHNALAFISTKISSVAFQGLGKFQTNKVNKCKNYLKYHTLQFKKVIIYLPF